jgi:uncharacterized protein (TIGR02687 family)
MSEHKISLALERLFQKHRIVFWYDNKHEFRKEFELLSLPDVEKIEIINNEFGVKYRILREQPEQKFLLYRDDCQPADLDNWLLDVQLAHGEFRTDLVAIWLSELELGLEFSELIEAHGEFFQAVKRKETLKNLLNADDTSRVIRLKMLAVCAGCEPRIDAVAENLFQELAEKRSDKMKLIERCHLDEFFWDQLERLYDYHSSEKSLKDFLIRVFQDCYEMALDAGKYLEIKKHDQQEKRQPSKMSQDVQVFIKRWKDSRQFEKGFETLSDEVSDLLGIENDLLKRDFRELIELDYFRLIDKKIISDLVQAVALSTVTSADVGSWVRQRRYGHWFNEFQHLYEAIDYASQFLNTLNEANLTMSSLVEGVQRYSGSWYKLDQLYRKFIYHVRMSGQTSLMGVLTEKIENLYCNNFLLKINDDFQCFVDDATRWDASPIPLQKTFFERWIRPFLKKENKVCVIISDAMRYEIGDELLSLIRQEDRYSAELEAALSMLPSYTQLGMAALLPNTSLEIADNETGTVLVDGISSQGTANRIKILDKAITQRTTACKVDELMSMKGDETRSLIRDHDVIYIYHNRIDATGDKRESEERVFEAVEETLQDLMRLIKKLTSANVNNLLITSDHGFIYQNRAIDESDFSNIDAQGDKILFKDRRFVFGKGLVEVQSLRKFTSSQLGLAGTVEVQIPKSINRLRLKGSGSRFVHGGASLQEVVIPVLKINKKRQSDTTYVEVEILRGASSIITSGQLAVTLYQQTPITDKIQSRILLAGIYTESGDLISDCHELTFNLTEENPRQREVQIRFLLTRKADDVNGQEVILKLEENHIGTSHYKTYKTLRYSIRRSFTSDFDF